MLKVRRNCGNCLLRGAGEEGLAGFGIKAASLPDEAIQQRTAQKA